MLKQEYVALTELEQRAGGIKRLDINPITLNHLGWREVIVGRSACDRTLGHLINATTVGDLHTWCDFQPEPGSLIFDQLCAFEGQRRPTEIFFYYGIPEADPASAVLFGAASVAEKISHSFPYAGFPVIARCLIAEPYRRFRLYTPLLRHRFEHCHERWGSDLLGIHMGTANAAVFAAIRNHFFDLPFVYVGNESFGRAKKDVTVFDFLWLSERLKAQMTALPSGLSLAAAKEWDRLKTHLVKMIENKFDAHDYLILKNLVLEYEFKANGLPQNIGIQKILTLMEAIPILEIENVPDKNVCWGDERRRKAA